MRFFQHRVLPRIHLLQSTPQGLQVAASFAFGPEFIVISYGMAAPAGVDSALPEAESILLSSLFSTIAFLRF